MSPLFAKQCFLHSSALLLMLCTIPLCSHAAPRKKPVTDRGWNWALPQSLSDANTTVTFTLESTWHDLQGNSSYISGRVWLEDQNDPLSVRAILNFPVIRLTTGGEMRDERMLEVMDSEHHKYVNLAVDSLTPKCDEQSFADKKRCPVELAARLTIRGNERTIILPGVLTREVGSVKMTGEVSFSWLDFGVEDPSIIIAKLKPEMRAAYTITLPTIGNEKR